MKKLTVYVFFFWNHSSGGHEWNIDKDVVLRVMREYKNNPVTAKCMTGFREFVTQYPADVELTQAVRDDITQIIDWRSADWEVDEEDKILASAQ